MSLVFRPRTTADASVVEASKSLIYADAGWGKTTQFAHYKRMFGKGFIISGEAGLSSISHEGIDYLPFSSWDGEPDANGGLGFKSICRLMATPEFRAQGYTWIGLDSLTELSDRLHEHLQAKLEAGDYRAAKGGDNKFEMWGDASRLLVGAVKWIRDLPYHVLVTALAKSETDENGATKYGVSIKGNAVAKQLPGLFDNVFAGIRKTEAVEPGTTPRVRRFVVTDEVSGWLGKVRDPARTLKPWEETGDVTSLLARIRDGANTPSTNLNAAAE